ncbi:MAG: hypothetical protein JWN50_360 [Parcubacteria group bacterium]|nr:hypothetical protein [Parcubacteria group bacterium]
METNIERIIEEVVPELSQANEPKKLGFLEAMKRVWSEWFRAIATNDGRDWGRSFALASAITLPVGVIIGQALGATIWWEITLSAAAGAAAGCLYTFLSGLGIGLLGGCMREAYNFNGYNRWMEKYSGHIAYFAMFPALMLPSHWLAGTSVRLLPLLPLLPWIGEAGYWMYRTQKDVRTFVRPALPTLEVVQQRVLDRMKKEIRKAKGEVVGPDSAFELRIARMRQKASEAETIQVRNTKLAKGADGDSRMRLLSIAEDAREIRDAFEHELQILLGEQKATLALFDEIEACVPAEESRLQEDLDVAKLKELRGEALHARAVSREMFLEAVGPSIEKIFALNTAKERLLSHSIAALQSVSLERFIANTENGLESVIRMEGTLRQIAEKAERGLVS